MKTDRSKEADVATQARETSARRLGRIAQAVVLALLLAAVALRLLQIDESLAFRYGGF